MSDTRSDELVSLATLGEEMPQAIGLAAAAKLMRGRGGRPPSVETVRRWANPRKGCYPQGEDGPQLVLCSVRLNGELLTLPRWVEDFERERLRLGINQHQPPPLPKDRTARRRAADQRRAAEVLDRAGIR